MEMSEGDMSVSGDTRGARGAGTGGGETAGDSCLMLMMVFLSTDLDLDLLLSSPPSPQATLVKTDVLNTTASLAGM